MRFKRVLLCIPPFIGRFGWPSSPHAGVGYLSVSLSAAEIEYGVFDMRLGNTFKRLQRMINVFKPDLVGLTMMTYRHKYYYGLVDRLKEGGLRVVIGGPHVSLFRKNVLENCQADFAIKNEGEKTLLELCLEKKLSSIAGLIYRDGCQIIENTDRPFVEELDSLPFPTYEKFPLSEYSSDEIPIISSRGCPYSCTFCAAHTSLGKKFRMRSAENVLEELNFWYKKGFRRFNFNDDNFTLDKERTYKICHLIERHNYKDLYLLCGNGVRADRVDRELLRRMKGVGFKYLAFGVESGNERILSSIKKGESLKDIEEAIKNSCDLGYEVALFFMIGNPEERPEDVNDTFSLALKYPIRTAVFYNVLPIPKTELYEDILKKGIFIRSPELYLNQIQQFDKEPFYETKDFTIKEKKYALKDADRVVRKIEWANFKRRLDGLTKSQKVIAYMRFFLRRLILFDRIVNYLQFQISKPKAYTRMFRNVLNTICRITGIKVRF